MRRIVVVGGPRTGKTTWAKASGMPVRHTDDLIPLGWSEASEAAGKWFDEPGPWVVEGVATARALRKWLALHGQDDTMPCDEVVLLQWPVGGGRSAGQVAMHKGVETVWQEIRAELRRRGVRIMMGTTYVPEGARS